MRNLLLFVACLAVLAALRLGGCASCTDNHNGGAVERGSPVVPAADDRPRDVRALDDDLAPLRAAFNDGADRWRVVALVSPTCSECVVGAQAVEREITGRYPAEQVGAAIVWIPMLESDNEQAARSAATIFEPRRVSQFYDAERAAGLAYARGTFADFFPRARKSVPDDHWLAGALDDREEAQRPQWDLYMLYAPGTRWADGEDAPPMPTRWIRHLGRLEDGKTSLYWQDTPESGPREGDLFQAIRAMADESIGEPQAMDATAMNIEVLGFAGCPNTPRTMTNVRQAAASLGLRANVVYVDQAGLPESDPRRGWPAPTVLIEGKDLFGMPAAETPARGCRMYEGGAPSEAEIAAALGSVRH